jgi:hypothetical protein
MNPSRAQKEVVRFGSGFDTKTEAARQWRVAVNADMAFKLRDSDSTTIPRSPSLSVELNLG